MGVVPRWFCPGVRVEGGRTGGRLVSAGGVSFGGGGSDDKISGGGRDEGGFGSFDSSRIILPDAGT